MLNFNFSQVLSTLAVAAVPALLGIILHEVAHGWAASRCGDPTAKFMAAPLPSQPRQAVGQPQSARFFPPAPTKAKRKKRTLTVGLAWDAAFSFCYADLPALLGELGAEVRTFSPLRDAAPPAGCAGLYFPGGYPELHARDLAANTPLHEALRALARQGMPIYGECGGYMYLMRSLRTAGTGDEPGPATFAMSGLLPRSCAMMMRPPSGTSFTK